jgi:Putative Actinobacterial Holin-X, holin superfamily III
MARNTSETDTARTLGTIVRELTEDITTLFRGEIALLKLEVKDTVAKLGGGIGWFAGSLAAALIGLAFLFVTILLVLIRLGVPAWLSALLVTVVLFAAAGVMALMGKKKFAAVQFVPTKSIESIKTDIEAIKSDIAQVRGK